jgi:hypothetical protein
MPTLHRPIAVYAPPPETSPAYRMSRTRCCTQACARPDITPQSGQPASRSTGCTFTRRPPSGNNRVDNPISGDPLGLTPTSSRTPAGQFLARACSIIRADASRPTRIDGQPPLQCAAKALGMLRIRNQDQDGEPAARASAAGSTNASATARRCLWYPPVEGHMRSQRPATSSCGRCRTRAHDRQGALVPQRGRWLAAGGAVNVDNGEC